MMYLGDFLEDATVYFKWSSNNGDGASITRAADGTVSVYKDDDAAQSTAGVTDTEDFDGVTGIHHCAIDTSADAFYVAGADYQVVLSAATIDGQTVNAVLAHFSIENRSPAKVSDVPTAAVNADAVWDEARADHVDAGSFGEPFNAIVSGAAVTGTLSTTQMTTDLTEATNDHYNSRIIVWITGDLAGQATDITDYDGGTKTLTFTAVTEAPADGDDFVIV